MFTEKELRAILALVARVQIQGSEAVGVVLVQQKIAQLLKEFKEKDSVKKERKEV